MAKIKFDRYGNPTPYDFIELTIEEFKYVFVDSFNPRERREYLFNKYIEYIKDFAEIYKRNWEQWINGSFTTKKEEPNDIDGVGLIDANFVDDERNKEYIKRFFRCRGYVRDVMYEYGLDMYLIPVYPEDDERYETTLYLLDYWKRWFSKDRQGRPKGIIKLMVNKNEL